MNRWELSSKNNLPCVSACYSLPPSSWSKESGSKICWAWSSRLVLSKFPLTTSVYQVHSNFELDSQLHWLIVVHMLLDFLSESSYISQIKCLFQDCSVSAYESGFRFLVIANSDERERLNGILSNKIIKQCKGRRK